MTTTPDINSPEADTKAYVWINEARRRYREGKYDAAQAAINIANAMMIGGMRA